MWEQDTLEVPLEHPRRESLLIREKLIKHLDFVAKQGLIAHGRGEAFDYLIGEQSIPPAILAERVGVALLKNAKNPVISVNGNTAALVPKEIIELAKLCNAKLEINLFYRTEERIEKIKKHLEAFGAENVLVGYVPKIKGLKSERAKVSDEGIFSADVVLVPLEDGDRTEALVKMGKKVIAIDLNPLSRTSLTASVTIVDNIIRAIPNMIKFAKEGVDASIINSFNNKRNLAEVLRFIMNRLKVLAGDMYAEK